MTRSPSKVGGGIPWMQKRHPYKDEMLSQANGQGMAGRKINNACKESRESRAALVRMKGLGAFLTGVKQATDK